MPRPTPLSRAHLAARSPSRPATTAASPPAARTPGRKNLRAMLAVPMTPQRTAVTLSPSSRPPAPAGIIPSGPGATFASRPGRPSPGRGYHRGKYRARPDVEDAGVNESSATRGGAGQARPGATAGPFRGVGVALVTIFGDDGEIDPGATGKLAVDLAARGMQAVLVCGSTGEAATLTGPERVTLIEAVRGAVPAGVPVIAGTGAPSARQAAALTGDAVRAGADLLLAFP